MFIDIITLMAKNTQEDASFSSCYVFEVQVCLYCNYIKGVKQITNYYQLLF